MKSFFSIRNLFLWGNLILLILFLFALVQDQKRGWKYYQKEFKAREIAAAEAKLAAATTDVDKKVAAQQLKAAKGIKQEIRQVWGQEIGAVDRCISCHMGYDSLSNPGLKNDHKEHPYSATGESPAFDIHRAHDFERFGCVVCHSGQGTATEKEAAHGRVLHWEKPLLTGTLVQASCVKCHGNHADMKVNGEVYTSEIIRAKKLFRESGCIGCHQIGGVGGPISVDLKEETSVKPLARIDFSYSDLDHKDWNLANWIKIHLTQDPATFVPGDPKAEVNNEPIAPSAMPPYFYSERDAEAMTAYVLSLNDKGIPPQFITPEPAKKKPSFASAFQRGKWVYDEYGCIACHGPQGKGGIRNFNYQYGVTPNLRRAVKGTTRAQIREKIKNGVPIVAKNDPHGPNPPLYMPAWKDKIKGQELEDLITYLRSIAE